MFHLRSDAFARGCALRLPPEKTAARGPNVVEEARGGGFFRAPIFFLRTTGLLSHTQSCVTRERLEFLCCLHTPWASALACCCFCVLQLAEVALLRVHLANHCFFGGATPPYRQQLSATATAAARPNSQRCEGELEDRLRLGALV